MKFPRPIITKEHGSWAALLVPMAVAAGTVGDFSLRALLLVVASLSFFMSTVPLNMILHGFRQGTVNAGGLNASKLWGGIYCTIGLVTIAPLFREQYWLLAPFGAAAALSFAGNLFLSLKFRKTVFSDLAGVAGLCLGAPMMYYVLTRSLHTTAWVLYLLTFLFFGSSVCYVHMKIHVTKRKRPEYSLAEKFAVGRLNLVYHAIVIAIIAALSLYRLTPATAIIAFVPMTIHAVYGTYRLSSRTSFSRLGVALLAHSIGFSILWIIIVHL